MSPRQIHAGLPALALCCLLAVPTLPAAAEAAAVPDPLESKEPLPSLKGRRFAIGLGASYVHFDTNFKFTEKATGYSIFVDAEGTLGLPEADTVGIIFGYYRLARRHGLGFSSFRIRRDHTLFAEEFKFQDLTFTGEATLSDKSSFYFLSYNYTFFEDDRSRVYGSFGLYGLDLDYRFEASGDITLGDEPVTSGSIMEEATIFAPLPMFGLDMWFGFTDRWSLGTKVSLVAGSYQDISAAVLDTTIRTRIQFTPHVGMILGITYFSARVDIDDEEIETEVSYGFSGAFLGMALVF
jgi:hypothetical protein